MRRALRIVLGAALALILLLAALLGVVAWRASRAPISVGFLIPRLEAAVNGEGRPVVRLATLHVVWDSKTAELELRAGDISVAEAGGARSVSIKAATVQLDPWALLRGRIVLSAVELAGATVRVARRADGSFGLTLEPSAAAATGSAGTTLNDVATGTGPFAQLRAFGLSEGAVLLVDEESGRSWSAAHVDAKIVRGEGGASLNGGFALQLGDARVPCEVVASLDQSARSGSARLDFHQLVPSQVVDSLRGVAGVSGVIDDASLAPFLASLTMPVDGGAELRFADGTELRSASLTLAGGSAELALPDVPGFRLGVKRFSIGTTLDVATDRFTVDEATLDVGEAVLHASASLDPLHGAGALDATATIEKIRTDALQRLWPPGLAASARAWVTANITSGSVVDLVFRARGKESEDQSAAPALESVEGELAFDGLSVRYVDTMPPVKDVKGRAKLSTAGLRFDVTGGRLLELEVPAAKVQIDLPAKGGPTIAIEASVRGPLQSALVVTDAEPLRVASAIGVDPRATAGTMDATARFSFPLSGTFRADRLRWSVAAKLRDAAVPRLINGWSLSDGALEVDAQPTAVAVSGRASLEGAPVEGSYRKALTGDGAQTADVRARLDRAQRAALGFDPGAWLDGPIEVTANLAQTAPERLSVGLDVDLEPATINVRALAVDKRPGQPGRARAKVTLVKNTIATVDGVDVSAAGATLKGEAKRAKDGARWSSLTTDLTLPVPADASRTGRVHLEVQDVKQGYSISLATPDAGALAAAYGRETLRGGTARFVGTLAGDGLDAPLDGRFEASSFTVAGMPWLVRLTTLASIDGLTSALTGRGVGFTSATADLALRGGTLKISSGVAQGPTMTVALDGDLNLEQGTIDATGTLLPIPFDRITDKIPLLGSLFGAAARSVFEGVDFSLKGPLVDPSVQIYPLSSLTPGALKSILRAVRRESR